MPENKTGTGGFINDTKGLIFGEDLTFCTLRNEYGNPESFSENLSEIRSWQVILK